MRPAPPTLRVLVIEDNPVTRKMVRVALETEGYRVDEAATAAEALAKVEAAPDIILQDLGLPDMNGFELARALRERPAGTGVPLIAFTGLMSEADKLRAGAVGFTDFLVKPIEPSRLLASLAAWRRRSAGPEGAGGGRRVLVVDDDPIQLKLARLRLEDAGFAVETAAGAAAALDHARQSPPAAVLSDVLMPELDGFGLARLLRREARLQGVPVVLMTSHYVEEADANLARRMGASGIALRSPSFDHVLRALGHALEEPLPPIPPDRDPVLERDHHARIAHQLERQVSLNSGLWDRVVVLSSSLSVLSSIARALADRRDTDGALREALSSCLDAAGLSKGALHLVQEDGRLELVAHAGLPELGARPAGDVFPPAALDRAAESPRPLVVPSPGLPERESEALLAALAARSALVVPIHAGGERLGILTLGSLSRSLVESDWLPFATAVGAQLALAVTLARAFRVREAAIESLELRERAIEALPDGLVITDARQPDHPVIYANPAFESLTGYSREEVLGRNCRFLQTESTGVKERRALRDALEAGRPVREELLNRRKDGTDYWVALELTPIRDAAGALSHYVGIMRDVTERRSLEEQLRQAQKMEAVGQLAGGVAHDFNNLLGVITGYAQLLKGELPNPHPGHRRIEMVLRASDRAAGLTRQLLAFGRKQILQPRVVALDRVVSGLEPMLRRLLGEQVQLVSVHHGGAVHVRADAGQVEQVVMNLAVNARDAMPKGGRLLLETRPLPSEGGGAPAWVELAVKDEGEGMTPEVKSHMFEPFFTTKEQGRGTGLGLATVYGIVKQSGGQISVETAPGRGTRFSILLPHVEPEPTVAAEPPRPASRRRAGGTILLVEDDDALRDLTREVLEKAGYTVKTARRPSEARALASAREPIDLVLADVVLPEMSGPELAERLREVHPEARVLFVSGYTSESVARHLHPDTPYLQKPFRPEDLLDRVEEVLHLR